MKRIMAVCVVLAAALPALGQTVKVFDGERIREVPMDAYVDMMSGNVPVVAVATGLVNHEQQGDPTLADLQAQINDIRVMVARCLAMERG